jgi:hypothetical protein
MDGITTGEEGVVGLGTSFTAVVVLAGVGADVLSRFAGDLRFAMLGRSFLVSFECAVNK